MNLQEKLFHDIAVSLSDVKEGKMFGALCIKASNGKAFVMFWHDYMIFKLQGEALNEALSLDGAKLFDPMGGRPMGGWVQLSEDYSGRWPEFAKKALKYVSKIKA
jgi:hypothetical protein